MTSPIKAGDLCEVVNGLKGLNSPNIGLIVRVLSCRGEHSSLGMIWRCEAEHAVLTEIGENANHRPGTADFAQSWLRKIVPPTNQNEKTTSKELTA